MRDSEEETTRRSKQANATASRGITVMPDGIEQIAELIKPMDWSWLETLGEWLLGALAQMED